MATVPPAAGTVVVSVDDADEPRPDDFGDGARLPLLHAAQTSIAATTPD
jgi:hypothetical protein